MTLILGGSGQLGTSFRKILPEALAPSHSQLDVTDVGRLRSYLDDHSPRCIINCSGFTNVDRAETDEGSAMAVNSTAVGELANRADHRGIPLVTFSTDYVFDGAADRPYVESDATNPINAYGRSKQHGEQLALAYPESLVIRTAWLFSTTHPNFVVSILRAAKGDQSLRVVDDQFGCPTLVDDLVTATMKALELRITGILHLAGSPAASRHQVAQAALEAAGMDPRRAAPCSTAEYPTIAERPRWSVLGTERQLAGSNGLAVGGWKPRLPHTIATLMTGGLAARR